MATDVKMFRGAAIACILPMALGLIGLALSLTGSTSLIQSGIFGDIGGFILLPMSICFVVGTPIAAWLACRRLKRIESLTVLAAWGSSATAGFIAATQVHFVAALLYTLFFVVAIIFTDGGVVAAFFGVVMLSGIVNLLLWAIITIPFALICATIFWRVTEFPQDTSVF